MIENICIIPHYGISGGSGKYTKEFGDLLSKRYNVSYFGLFSSEYSDAPFEYLNFFWAYFFKYNIVPNYKGNSKLVRYLYTFLSYLLSNIWVFKKRDNLSIVFVLTSSIQAPLIPLLNKKFVNAKIIILIQENVILDDSIVSRTSVYRIIRANLIFCIDKFWQTKATDFGINALLWTNKFSNDFEFDEDLNFDILYIGGDQKIKGFWNLIQILEAVEKFKIPVKVCLLGDISNKNMNLLISKKFQYINCEMVGFVENVFVYIAQSNFLLLPIESPHFLRPAIEAGILKKPFIIKRLENIESFAIDRFNCLMYDTIFDAAEAILFLINSPSDKLELGKNNYFISREFDIINIDENSFFENLIL